MLAADDGGIPVGGAILISRSAPYRCNKKMYKAVNSAEPVRLRGAKFSISRDELP